MSFCHKTRFGSKRPDPSECGVWESQTDGRRRWAGAATRCQSYGWLFTRPSFSWIRYNPIETAGRVSGDGNGDRAFAGCCRRDCLYRSPFCIGQFLLVLDMVDEPRLAMEAEMKTPGAIYLAKSDNPADIRRRGAAAADRKIDSAGLSPPPSMETDTSNTPPPDSTRS